MRTFPTYGIKTTVFTSLLKDPLPHYTHTHTHTEDFWGHVSKPEKKLIPTIEEREKLQVRMPGFQVFSFC